MRERVETIITNVCLGFFWLVVSIFLSCETGWEQNPSASREDVAVAEGACPEWTVYAETLIQEMEKCESQLNAFSRYVSEGISWEEALGPEGAKAFSAISTIHEVEDKLDIIYWKLWRLTGEPPLLDPSDFPNGLVASVSKNINSYREFVRNNGQMGEEALQRRGLLGAVQELDGPYWGPAYTYLFETIHIRGLYSSKSSSRKLYGGQALPSELRRNLVSGLVTWLKKYGSDLYWDAKAKRFFFRPDAEEALQSLKKSLTPGRTHGANETE